MGDRAKENLPGEPLKKNSQSAVTEPKAPEGGPPLEGSLAAFLVGAINTLKVDWIDVLLRQLVVIVGFLGAMLATRRRKHINIDAVSRLLPDQGRRVVGVLTNLLSVVTCVFLAAAGVKLVQISREFPTELTEWANEWSFQLMFPIGFSLLAFHFAIRTLESCVVLKDRLPVGQSGVLEGEPDNPPGLPGGPPDPDPDPPQIKPSDQEISEQATNEPSSTVTGEGVEKSKSRKKDKKSTRGKRKKGGRR